MQQWCCSNGKCTWTATSSLSKKLSGKMHVDLIKLQAEYGANKSYRKAAIDLSRVVGERAINNHMRIRKITKKVGEILSDNNSNVKKPIKPCEELYAVADGGHVHDANNPGHNFEAMMGKIYKPSNVVRIDENHTKIIEKHCAGSGKYDKQKTMKANFINAAVKEGIDKTKTTVIAFADGAKNCWNILESLAEVFREGVASNSLSRRLLHASFSKSN